MPGYHPAGGSAPPSGHYDVADAVRDQLFGQRSDSLREPARRRTFHFRRRQEDQIGAFALPPPPTLHLTFHHPDFRTNGQFFVFYSVTPRGSVVSRFRVCRDDPDRADRNSEEKLLQWTKPYGNHNGGCLRFGPDGQVEGEYWFLGLFTTSTYRAAPQSIPIVRGKVDYILRRAAFPPDSHDAKALLEILESYPRDALFHVSAPDLFEIAMGLLGLGERPRVRLFVWRDALERFVAKTQELAP